MENRSFPANWMAFIDEITGLDDDGDCVGLQSLDFYEFILMKKTRMKKSQHRAHEISPKGS